MDKYNLFLLPYVISTLAEHPSFQIDASRYNLTPNQRLQLANLCLSDSSPKIARAKITFAAAKERLSNVVGPEPAMWDGKLQGTTRQYGSKLRFSRFPAPIDGSRDPASQLRAAYRKYKRN